MRKIPLLFVAMALCGLLAACGARGSLEAPEGAPRQPPDQPITLDKTL